MPTLEIITIGTELLLGEIQDTNSTYIARTLRDHGIDIYRITTIGDNAKRISQAIKEALSRAEIVITTGGLGPTVDDPTREAVALATDRELVFLPTLWDQILERYKVFGHQPTENNRRQAYIPKDAIPIHNPVGTAPCFIVEIGDSVVASLPGVPSEMKLILHQSIIPFLHRKFELNTQIIKATVLHAATMGESAIDNLIGDLEELANPTVGLLAHPGQTDIRVTAKAASEEEAQALAQPVIDDLLDRLGEAIYGKDDDTLESVVTGLLKKQGASLGVIEYGMDGKLIERIQSAHPENFKSFIHDDLPEDLPSFELAVKEYCHQLESDVCLGTALIVDDKMTVYYVYQDKERQVSFARSHGGPKDHGLLWAENTGLDFLRQQLLLERED